MSALPIAADEPPLRRPLVGYAMVLVAATLFGVNGSVAKVALSSGLSSLRLSEARCAGACIGLMLIVLVRSPSALRLRRDELLRLSIFGLFGVALVQLFYFLAIHRLAIGIALLIQYLAPLLVALWARYVFHEHVRRRIWLALALALGGLALIVNVANSGTISTAGVLFSLLAALTYALYILLAEHAVGDRDAVSLLAWGFAFAALFWAIIAPWWTFPWHRVGVDVSLLGRLGGHHLPVWSLMSFMVVVGTIVPFFLLVSALRHLPATRVGIIAMLEPVIATIVAWAWLEESLGAAQLAGAAVVLGAILLAQTAR
jgi:drug/metabolite transporter (DMT)-like permease